MILEVLEKAVKSLVALVQANDAAAHSYFMEYVRPTYETTELVFKNYLATFNQVRKRLEEPDATPNEILAMLTEAREEFLTERIHLAGLEKSIEADALGPASRRDFKRAVSSLLLSHPSHVLVGTWFTIIRQAVAEYARNPTSAWRDSVRRILTDAASDLEEQWKYLAQTYEHLRSEAFPPPPINRLRGRR